MRGKERGTGRSAIFTSSVGAPRSTERTRLSAREGNRVKDRGRKDSGLKSRKKKKKKRAEVGEGHNGLSEWQKKETARYREKNVLKGV